MLELKDFIHLAPVEPLLAQLAREPGLALVAGLDPRTPPGADEDIAAPASGRATFFRILMRQMLAAPGAPRRRAAVVSDSRAALRVPRQLRSRVELIPVRRAGDYPKQIAAVAAARPGLLIVERLDAETAGPVLDAAASGLRVLSQLDTINCGAAVARELLELGVTPEQLAGLHWVIAVQRLPTLCARCKQPATPDAGRLVELRSRYPQLELSGPFYRPAGCAACRQTGREGDVAAFDFFHADGELPGLLEQPSALPFEAYAAGLAALGLVALDDSARVEREQLHQAYRLLSASERSLADTSATLQRKLAQLEAANRVLEQRTQALVSLQGISHALVAATGLSALAGRLCQQARDLCGADRAVLYYLRPGDTADILAISGWDSQRVPPRVPAVALAGGAAPEAGEGPQPYAGWPPGIAARHADVEGAALRAGLRVSLVAQGEPVGVMIVHATQKPQFQPGERALLQAFADQAALALQRAGLIEALEQKIAELEAAQAALVAKERLERELELARQVQQSMLPTVFPLVPGYRFAARSETARQVGGDFYDVILLDADRFGVVVADASDKGMPAALFMALARSLIYAEARREPSPRAVLYNVHRLLRALGQHEMFVTAFYGVIDGAARRLTYTRAGHDRPLLLRDGRAVPLAGAGTILGYLDEGELALSEERLELLPGDRLALYSDGLIDALSPDGQMFGLARLAALLAEDRGESADDLCARVFSEIGRFQGAAEQYDDMTLLVVAVEP